MIIVIVTIIIMSTTESEIVVKMIYFYNPSVFAIQERTCRRSAVVSTSSGAGAILIRAKTLYTMYVNDVDSREPIFI